MTEFREIGPDPRAAEFLRIAEEIDLELFTGLMVPSGLLKARGSSYASARLMEAKMNTALFRCSVCGLLFGGRETQGGTIVATTVVEERHGAGSPALCWKCAEGGRPVAKFPKEPDGRITFTRLT